MGRYVGWACGYRMVPLRRADMSNGWVYMYFKYVKYIKYWLKKGVGTGAILEDVGISAPLMGRYIFWACGY